MPNSAWAMAAPPPGQAGPAAPMDYVIQFAPLILIFGVFYFLLIRPQQKKQKELQELIQNLKKGDKVVTSGGLIGVIADIKNDRKVLLKLGEGSKEKESVKVEVLKSYIISVEKE